MNSLSFLAMSISDLWYAMPLIVVVSLVYSATRHEAMPLILRRAARMGAMVFGVMAAIFVFLLLISYWL